MEIGEEEGRDGDCWLWLMKNLDVLDLGTHPTILPSPLITNISGQTRFDIYSV